MRYVLIHKRGMYMALQITNVKFAPVYRQKAAIVAAVLMGIVASAIVALQVSAVSPSTVTVTQSNEAALGWNRTEASGASIKYVKSDSGTGTGALEMTTPTDASYARLRNDSIQEQLLSSIYKLSYMTKKISGDTGVAAVNLRFYIDTSGDGNFDDVLVYEPYYNAAVTDMNWQTWNITQSSGKWWSNYALTYSGKGGVGAGSIDSNFMLSDVVSEHPNATVVEYGLGTGTDNSPWVVQADALTINDTTYDFEPIATDKDNCKDDGWKNYGTIYKNQGHCVAAASSKNR